MVAGFDVFRWMICYVLYEMRRMFRRFKMMQKHWFWNLCIESPLGPCTSRTPPLLYLMQNAVPTLYAAMVLRCGGRRYSPVKVAVEG
jgi:hypothetical protein